MKSLLVPTDHSTNANNAIRYSNNLAKSLKAKITLLHAYPPMIGRYNIIPGLVAEDAAIQKKDNEKKLEKIKSKYLTAPTKSIVKIGEPIDEIIETAEKTKAQLIIMGTQGATGLKKILFGSNTVDVIAKSNTPVLAIPKNYRFKTVKTIVYTTDFQNTINELKHIVPIAKQLNATIEVLNLKYKQDNTKSKKEDIAKSISKLSYKKIKMIEQKATIEIPMNEQLKKYLLKRKPEMLVMFPEKRNWFDSVFIGSKTEDLATQLKLPLLSIRKAIVKAK